MFVLITNKFSWTFEHLLLYQLLYLLLIQNKKKFNININKFHKHHMESPTSFGLLKALPKLLSS